MGLSRDVSAWQRLKKWLGGDGASIHAIAEE